MIDVGAQLHATWWNSPRLTELTWLRPLNNPAYMGVGDQYAASWPVFAEMFASAPSAALEIGERIGPQLPFTYDWLMANRPTTLAHTDFRLDNFFFGRPGAPVTVIDWQLSVRSVGAFDIGYFIVQSLTTEMRREHGEELVSRWHRGLVDRGVRGYSWDEALRDFHDSVMLQMSIPVISAANLDPANERGKQLLDCMGHRAARPWSTTAAWGCGPPDLGITLRIAHPFATVCSFGFPNDLAATATGSRHVVRWWERANHLGGVAAGRVHH